MYIVIQNEKFLELIYGRVSALSVDRNMRIRLTVVRRGVRVAREYNKYAFVSLHEGCGWKRSTT